MSHLTKGQDKSSICYCSFLKVLEAMLKRCFIFDLLTFGMFGSVRSVDCSVLSIMKDNMKKTVTYWQLLTSRKDVKSCQYNMLDWDKSTDIHRFNIASNTFKKLQ